MNKQHYRLIFNKLRGILMAVAEHIASSGKSTQETRSSRTTTLSAQPSASKMSIELTLKPSHFAVLCRLGLVSLVSLSVSSQVVYADIIADHTAPVTQRPVILNAPNGVPLVNIQAPSAAGVSRNTYSQFDVNANGVILNNSRTNVQTQLGGFVEGNPYLATGSARIILNEVNSSNPSLLNGYVEVAGSRAQVVIANPAGISCNGCGFINANRATLTTGTSMISGGDLIGYRVTGGSINFLGAGLDASQTDYTDVIARAVNVNAGLWANHLNVITGSNQVNVNTSGDASSITPIAGTGTVPTLAIDVAALGGMYAGKIHLIGTEAGVGVSNAGVIGASVGEVVIDVNGQLTNSNRISSATQVSMDADSISNTGGRVTAEHQLNVTAASLSGDGVLLSGGDIDIQLTTDYTQKSTGQLQANDNLNLTTTGNIINEGSLLAANTLTLQANDIENAAAAEITGLNTHINANSALTNRGLIDGGDTFINADILNNIGTGSIFGDHIALTANTVNNDVETIGSSTTAAVIAARTALDIGATNINNRENALLFSAGNLAIGGALDTSHHATGQASTLNNASATIEALGNLSLNVATINNTNAHLTTQYVRTSVASTLAASVDVRGNIGSPAPAAGNTRQYQMSYFTTDDPLLFGRIYNYDDVDHFYLDGSGFVHLVLKASVANDGMTDANTFMQYNSGSIVYETQILSTQPGQILAGNNMQVDANNLLNSDSKMIAGGIFNANVVTLNNQETLGSRSTQYGSESAYFRTRESCDCSRYFQYPNYPAPIIESINLGGSAYGAVSTVTGTGTTVATLAAPSSIPTSSLFTPTTSPESNYLIETNPRFANYRTWLSSDYMLNALHLDPALITKRLGDGFYEQRLIREQINTLTGQRFLVGYANDEAQYQALMANGATFATSHQLVPGVALTAAQVAQLTSDIVWLVEQTVTLPNGTTTQALVPQVYTRLQANDLSPTGSLIAGQSLHLNVTGDVINSGDLSGRDELSISASNIQNLAGRIRANQTQLTAANDINNLGGQIIAADSMRLDAGHDINIQSTTTNSTLKFDLDQGNKVIHVDNQRTNIDRVAGLYITNPSGTGLLVASAGNNLNLDGAEIVNLTPHASDNTNSGQTLLKAGNNISLGTVTTTQNNSYVQNAKNYNKDSNHLEVGSTIQTAGNITLQAGQDLNIKAGNIESTQGSLTGSAGNDINITTGTNTYDTASASYKKSSGFMSSSKKTRRDTSHDTEVVSSNLSAETITLNAGTANTTESSITENNAKGDINVKGANVVATHDVNLNATGNVDISAAQATHDETHYKKVQKTGFSPSGGASIGYGTSKLTNTNDSQQVTNVGSTVGSVEGDVTINSGKTYNQTGSDVVTPQGDINITAQQVNIAAATDNYASQQTMKYKQTGLTLAITSPVISAIQTVQQMSKAASNTKDGRMQALAAGTAALAANNALDAVSAGQAIAPTGNAANDAANQAGGINISLSIGTSKSSSSSQQTSSAAASSHLNAGNNITIKATGAGQDSDINVIGSQIKAAHDVTLKAEDQINLQAAQNVDTLKSTNKGSSASLGIGFSLGGSSNGFTINAGVSGSKGNTKGNGSTWTETVIQGGNNTGDKVTLQSGTDTNVIGSQVIGNQIIADVGTSGTGNLNIQSLQDSNTFKDKQSNFGVSVSLCIPPFCVGASGGSVSAGQSKINSNYASVNEQAGFFAGDGGYQANVNGNTNLTGAVMASTDKAIQDHKNSLTTQTLTISNIENSAEYSAKGASFSAGVGLNKQPNGTFTNAPTASAGSSNLSDDSRSVTVSGISGGTLTITNSAQQALTGQDTATTVATLNRDVKTQLNTTTDENGNTQTIATAVDSQGNNLAGTLKPIFDKDQVQRELNAQIQITQAFSQVAPKAVADYAGKQLHDLVVKAQQAHLAGDEATANQLLKEAEMWGDGGAYRVALHTLVGGLSGNLEGALGAGTSAALIPKLGDQLENLDIPVTLKQALIMATSAAIGEAVGGIAGAGTAFSEATNNYLNHTQLANKRTELANAKTEAERKAIEDKYNRLDTQQQQDARDCVMNGDGCAIGATLIKTAYQELSRDCTSGSPYICDADTKNSLRELNLLLAEKAGNDTQLITDMFMLGVGALKTVTGWVTKEASMLLGMSDTIKNIRSELPSRVANSGNMATSSINIEGLPNTMTASSNVNELAYGLIGNGGQNFTWSNLPNAVGSSIARNTDSEYKILDNIADQLGNNTSASGSIKIFTERPACDSCMDVANQFRNKYPNINVTIYNNNGVVLGPKTYVSPTIFNIDNVGVKK